MTVMRAVANEGYLADNSWALLRRHLLGSYQELVRMLARRLRSVEQAEDALQDTFLRLERGGEIGEVKSPRGYLLRMALNIAAERRRGESRYVGVPGAGKEDAAATSAGPTVLRRLTVSDGLDVILRIDDAPGPEQIAADRSELKKLAKIVAELPSRRRAIFMAAWVEGRSHQEIAKSFGLSLRSIQHELKLARHYCLSRYKEE
jgi:RNA polymerase sigma-70 factor, ECF subfamily